MCVGTLCGRVGAWRGESGGGASWSGCRDDDEAARDAVDFEELEEHDEYDDGAFAGGASSAAAAAMDGAAGRG